MKKIFFPLMLLFITSALLAADTKDDPLARLKAGNKRFFSGESTGIRRSGKTREALVSSQSPFCAILACADSRVAPEIIFDQGIGDLFVVRVAGNVASESVIESLDFSVDALGVSLIVVMGHQNCGAIQSVRTHTGDKELGKIATMIEPSTKGRASLKDAIIANAKAQVETLRNNPILRSVTIIPAYYDFESGIVEFLNN